MTDYILEISIPSGSAEIEETIRGLLFLSPSTGDVLVEEDWYLVLSAFFDSREDRAAFRKQLGRFGGLELRDIDQERADWLEQYEQSLVPLTIGTRFIVVPDRRLLGESTEGRIPIVIPQERAFGTGSHETTALCLEMLEHLHLPGRVCVDIGTGSGLLAIGMAMLGARRVVAFDNDPDTLGVVGRNLRRNGIEAGRVVQFVGGPEALRGAGFELATMNIIPEVIIPLLPLVSEMLEDSASLVVSGILRERRSDVVEAAQAAGFELAEEKAAGEWWCGRLIAKPGGEG